MCAIGCLITDEAYTSEIEELPVTCVEVCTVLKKSGIEVESQQDLIFLIELQNIHDNREVEMWKDCLTSLAKMKI